MYLIKGKYASALLTIDNLDSEAVSQLYGLLNAVSSEGSKVTIMPDGHPGGSCLVGFTQRFVDGAETRIVPNFVGGEIANGCEYSKKDIQLIQALIMATVITYRPRTLCEKIIRDADLFHLGTDCRKERSRLLRKELANCGQTFSDAEWRLREMAFVNVHQPYIKFS